MDEVTPSTAFEVECPHCHKSFTGQPLVGDTARHSGFKCPHCRLFVPYARVKGQDVAREPEG